MNNAVSATRSDDAIEGRMRNGLDVIRADSAQVEAAATALQGYRLEHGYGLRSTLDVLIADWNLPAAQVPLAQRRHNAIVAEASLLAATAWLEAHLLLLRETPYDQQAGLPLLAAVRPHATVWSRPWTGPAVDPLPADTRQADGPDPQQAGPIFRVVDDTPSHARP